MICQLSNNQNDCRLVPHISYPYLRRPTRVKPKLKEVRHESSLCRQDLDGLSPVAFKKNTLRSYESVITPILPGPWQSGAGGTHG
jgi:hypothetical protein